MPPAIATQPGGVAVLEGATAAFTTAATGGQPLAYQWLLDGGEIGGVVFANNNTTDGSAVAGCSTSLCYHYYANREGLIDISGTNYIQSDGTPAAIYAADHQGNLRVEGPATEMIYQGVITVSIATAYTLGPTGEIVVTGGSGPYTYLDGGTGVGYIAGTTMTLQSVTGGTLFVKGQQLTGGTILGGTTIVSQLSGSAGGAGTYQVNASQTVGSAGSPITITGTSAVSGKCWYADQGYMQWAGGSTSCVSTQNTNQVGFPGSVAGATAGSLPGFHL